MTEVIASKEKFKCHRRSPKDTIDQINKNFHIMAIPLDSGIYYHMHSVMLCMLEIFACFCVVCGFFSSKLTFSRNSFRNTIRVSNSLDPDQA